jgi:septal ring factor EnvC (AmiA/AmiB activator)
MKKIFLYLLTCFVVIGGIGQSKDELEKRRKEIQDEIAQLQRSQSAIQKDKKASLGQLSLIRNKIRKRYAVINNINDQVRLIDNNIFTNNREIFRLKKQLDTLREQYANTIVYAYQNRSSYDMINFIFSATSFNDAIRRVSYLKSYRGYREEQVANINKTSLLLEQRISTLSESKKEKSQVLQIQTKEMRTLEVEKKEQNSFVLKLKAREKELQKEMAAKKRLDRNLQNAIAAIVKREIENARRRSEAEAKKATATARAKESKGTSGPAATAPKTTTTARKSNVLENTPEVTKVSVNFEQNKRNLPWPVDRGNISSPFGKRKIEGTSLIEDNIGVTIATPEGANVKAVFEGIVSAIYDVAGSQTVTLKHGKYFTTYYNLSTVSVSKGQAIKMGQSLGKAGVNDDGDGEILFVVNIESRFMDPEQWLKSR